MSLSNGRPEPEVIVNVRFFIERQLIHAPDTTTLCTLNPAVYADGFAYSKHKMEEAFRPGGFLEKVAPKPPAAAKDPLKREDVDLIIHEFEISRAQAEKVLTENGSDVVKALNALVAAPSNKLS